MTVVPLAHTRRRTPRHRRKRSRTRAGSRALGTEALALTDAWGDHRSNGLAGFNLAHLGNVADEGEAMMPEEAVAAALSDEERQAACCRRRGHNVTGLLLRWTDRDP